MTLSRAGLLVAIAVSVPLVLELRTVLAFVGIDLPLEATVAIGIVVIAALIAWSRVPSPAESPSECQ